MDPTFIYLENQSVSPKYRRYLGGAECTVSTGSFTCDLSGLGFTGNEFYGKVLLGTEPGWYVGDASGQVAADEENLNDNYVTPTPHLEYVAIEKNADGSGRVYLYGSGFSGSTIYPRRLKIGTVELGSSSTSVKPSSSTQASFNVSKDTMEAIQSGNSLDADAGWLVSSGNNSMPVFGVPIRRSDLRGVSYNPSTDTITLYGSGFDGGTVNLHALDVVLRNDHDEVIVDLSYAEIPADRITATSIQFKLGPTQAQRLETVDKDGRYTYSRNVILKSKGNWYESDGRQAPDLPDNLVWRGRNVLKTLGKLPRVLTYVAVGPLPSTLDWSSACC